MYDNISMNSS